MENKPNDRLSNFVDSTSTEEPRIYVILDGKKFPRPGLETFFADVSEQNTATQTGCSCHPVVGTYCKCNKVTVCGCVGHTSSSSGGGGCRCAPVH
jgi:hypothetical protein